MKILVLGDVCNDVYIYGRTDRKNPEAAAPLLNNTITEVRAGMAANVANNLIALGAEVHTIFPPASMWSEKNRYIDEKHGTQLLRVDYDRVSDPMPYVPHVPDYDAVVISDYNKGMVKDDLLKELDGKTNLFVDTKKRELGYLKNAWVKVNEREHELILTPPKRLVVTLGNRGSMFEGRHARANSVNVIDPCGAGDTYLAAFAWHMVREPDNVMGAMEFANLAAAVTCQHRGTYAPALEEIHR